MIRNPTTETRRWEPEPKHHQGTMAQKSKPRQAAMARNPRRGRRTETDLIPLMGLWQRLAFGTVLLVLFWGAWGLWRVVRWIFG